MTTNTTTPSLSTWEDNAHYQGWYPVCCSSELDETPLLGKPFLGTRVVVYRDARDAPVVLHAYCAHFGADLAVGELVGDEVQCGFHHFRYGPDGVCTWAPGDRVPDAARVFSFPAAERWGVVWAFNGTEPLYDVPGWPGKEDAALVTRVRKIDVPCDPWVLVANAYDVLHLSELHQLEVPVTPSDMRAEQPYVMEYDVTWEASGVGTMHNRGRSHGTNAFTAVNVVVGGDVLMTGQASTPTADGKVECYMFAAAPDTRDGSPEVEDAIDARLRAVEDFVDRLVKDDLPILYGLQFRIGATVAGDRLMNYFLNFVKTFPRAIPERLGESAAAAGGRD